MQVSTLILELVSLVASGILVCIALLKWNETRFRRKGLPPGTMGWPVFGETKDFMQKGPEFMKSQRKRYGNVFKTHILGSPAAISMDPDLNRFILLNESKGLVPGYPKSMVDILGRNIATVSGATHKYVRRNLLSLVGIPAIKDRLFRNVITHTWEYVSRWDGLTIDFQTKAMELAFVVMFRQIVDDDSCSGSIYDEFKAEFDKLQVGTLSLPINFPGTSYRIGLKAKKNVDRILMKLLEERRASKGMHCDMLESLARNEEQKHPLNDDEEIIEQIVTILYSGYETVSKTLMMSVKYLHDHPEALQQLRDEHFAVKEKKGGKPLDWEDYKAMRFTRAVILEVSRLSTIVNGVLRKTMEDVELNGFLVPKGWRIYVYTRELNYDPLLYSEPFKFNPWRWLNGNLEANQYCLLFGGGGRLCPGKELGIVKVTLFLHLFVTTYRWEEVGEPKLRAFPRVEAPNGYHIKISKLDMQ